MRNKLRGKTIALIPARGGSKGIPRKNLVDLGGVPLIAWSILAALEASEIDEVYVSTEDEEIAEVSRKYGAKVPFLRPDKLSDDNVGIHVPVNHYFSLLREQESNIDVRVVLFPTHPFRTPQLIDDVVKLCRQNQRSVLTTLPKYWQPGFWVGERASKWHSVASDQDGPICQTIGLVCADFSEERKDSRPDILLKRIQHVLTRIDAASKDGSTRPREMLNRIGDLLAPASERIAASSYSSVFFPTFGRGEILYPVSDKAMLTDIDTPIDLEIARKKLYSGALTWLPEGITAPRKVAASLMPSLSSDEKPQETRVVVISTAQESSSRFEFALERLPSPGELRRLIDREKNLKGVPVLVSKSSAPIIPEVTDTTPVICLSDDRRVAAHAKRTLIEIGGGSFFGGSKQSKVLSAENSPTFFVSGQRIEFALPSSPKYRDQVRLIIRTRARRRTVYFGVAEYDGVRWRDTQDPVSSVVVTLPIYGNDRYLYAFSPEEPLSGHAIWLRAELPTKPSIVFEEPLEIPGWLRYDLAKQSWLNLVSNQEIHGRQSLPEIYEWAGWAYLPADVSFDEQWKVLRSSEINSAKPLSP